MTQCERLQALLDEAVADGNEAMAEALRSAMEAAGCNTASLEDEGGGNGNGPPSGNGPG